MCTNREAQPGIIEAETGILLETREARGKVLSKRESAEKSRVTVGSSGRARSHNTSDLRRLPLRREGVVVAGPEGKPRPAASSQKPVRNLPETSRKSEASRKPEASSQHQPAPVSQSMCQATRRMQGTVNKCPFVPVGFLKS